MRASSFAAKLKKEDAGTRPKSLHRHQVGVQAVGYSDGNRELLAKSAARSRRLRRENDCEGDQGAGELRQELACLRPRIRKIGLRARPSRRERTESRPSLMPTSARTTAWRAAAQQATANRLPGDDRAPRAEGRGRVDFSAVLQPRDHAACNQIDRGMPDHRPRPRRRPPRLPSSLCPIARLHEAILLQTGSLGLAAGLRQEDPLPLGRSSLDPDKVSSWQGDPENGFDTPTEIVDAKPGMKVKKFGRTTGLTHGVVDAIVADPFPRPLPVEEIQGRGVVPEHRLRRRAEKLSRLLRRFG